MMIRAEVLQVLRVALARVGFPRHFVLIVPSATSPELREFYVMSQDEATALYMFGCSVGSDEEAVELALSNAPEYIW